MYCLLTHSKPSVWTQEKKERFQQNFTAAASKAGLAPEAFHAYFQSLDIPPQHLNAEEKIFLTHTFLGEAITVKEGNASLLVNLKVNKNYEVQVNDHLSQHLHYAVVVDKQLMASKLTDAIKNNFNDILAYTSLLVFLILWACYGRIELTLITFLPMLISWVWILGLMALLGIEFNIVNIIISTFIFGLGDDYSIFLMEGLQSEYASGKKNLASYKTAIFLSMLTTLVGVGVLIFAQHPAMKSIALISVVGILCVLVIGYLFIPFLFRKLILDRAQKQLPPITLFGFTRSLFAFLVFVLGCIALTFTGLVLFKLFRLKNEKVKYAYHFAIMGLCRMLVYVSFAVKKRIINPSKEDFSQPAVIIANHQSFLDILTIAMLHPKLIFFTNNWVWNSPFFGSVVRMADFYTIDDGIENSLEQVKKKVELGYSIVIFPEGARSKDGSIKRFHKGAFYLAETLQLDIVPIVLHGMGHCMVKNDFLLNKGIITMKILPRVSRDDVSMGATYQEKAKAYGQLFRKEYAVFNTPAFFSFRLHQNYIYKGPVLEWYMRVKVALEKNYSLFNDHLPQQGLIYDLGCGYGFLSHMLSWLHPDRQVVGIDYDNEKIAVAAHVQKYGLEYPQFRSEDLKRASFLPCQGIILADVLHYLKWEDQLLILRNCLGALDVNGVLIVRDGDSNKSTKHKNTKLTELFSTKLLGFNKTETSLEFIDFVALQKELHQMATLAINVIEESGTTSNTVIKITKLA